ncbi:copper resistance CopC family protein [Microbacterium sp. SD291]|uniref:copper resistance CopC family protein n=1 Tax=Microbacterium sp. SD291 TaxID=2782007 RepID=UPI001A96930E|nr:copper resistance CopC family protein [Microbacterium sp. SD291]MBO0979757.1 copper resistance protein CopC [Microbacterium sp. SD291]
MKTTARSLPTAPIALAAALLTALLVLFAPLSASAHDALTGSSPADGSTVDTLPSELTLTFSAKLIGGEGATEVVVTDAAGATMTDGAATVDGAIVTQPLVAEAEAGEYHVIWKVVSSDGHPTSGEFSFTVSTSTAAAPAVEPTTEASDEPLASTEPVPTATPEAPENTGDSTGIWMLGILGGLIVLAVVIVLLSRRGNGRRSESDTPAAR